jgi:cytochrome c
MKRMLVTLLMLTTSTCYGMAQETDARNEKGKLLAENLCAACHAIGETGNSPHPSAPPFRTLEQRLDLDSFVVRLRENLTSGHPDMPTFRFTRDDARALVAYLRSIQRP